MFFGNSRITLHRTPNCDKYGLTDKNFLVSFSNGVIKDDIFLGYFKNCLDSQKQLELSRIVYTCTNSVFCETGLSAGASEISLGYSCEGIFNGLTADFHVIENSFPEFGQVTIASPFCTGNISSRYAPWWLSSDCSCPPNYEENEQQSYVGDCFRSFPIETIGLNSTSEINPCRFFFFTEASENNWNWNNYVVNPLERFVITILFKTYDSGDREVCKAVTMDTTNQACTSTLICWPPGGVGDELIRDPISGELTTPCDICSGLTSGSNGDACNPGDVVVVNAVCRCPDEDDCWGSGSTSGSTSGSNCFFYPGITTGEPCVNGSWNGQICTDGYNNVCGSTECIDRICKEMDWFIANYGSSSANFQGYSSFPLAFSLNKDEWFIACGQTSVNYFESGSTGTTNFGDTTTRRNWGRIVGLLNYFATDGIPNEGGIGQTTVPLESDICREFYPTQVCCASLIRGSSFHDCPFCSITGFASSYGSQTVCCCSDTMTPLILGIAGASGFDNAMSASSIGLQPTIP